MRFHVSRSSFRLTHLAEETVSPLAGGASETSAGFFHFKCNIRSQAAAQTGAASGGSPRSGRLGRKSPVTIHVHCPQHNSHGTAHGGPASQSDEMVLLARKVAPRRGAPRPTQSGESVLHCTKPSHLFAPTGRSHRMQRAHMP